MFDGRFRSVEDRSWSAAVLRCTDGLVIFEHPDPLVRIPLSVLREFIALPGYVREASIHRFSDAGNEVARRLEELEEQLRFFAS